MTSVFQILLTSEKRHFDLYDVFSLRNKSADVTNKLFFVDGYPWCKFQPHVEVEIPLPLFKIMQWEVSLTSINNFFS